MKTIFHIAEKHEFERSENSSEYVPDCFELDGFIHCSYARQVNSVAELRFRGRKNLILLEIDRTLVPAIIVDENLTGGDELYPHIYGCLPIVAIISAREISVPEHGSFELSFDEDVC